MCRYVMAALSHAPSKAYTPDDKTKKKKKKEKVVKTDYDKNLWARRNGFGQRKKEGEQLIKE